MQKYDELKPFLAPDSRSLKSRNTAVGADCETARVWACRCVLEGPVIRRLQTRELMPTVRQLCPKRGLPDHSESVCALNPRSSRRTLATMNITMCCILPGISRSRRYYHGISLPPFLYAFLPPSLALRCRHRRLSLCHSAFFLLQLHFQVVYAQTAIAGAYRV